MTDKEILLAMAEIVRPIHDRLDRMDSRLDRMDSRLDELQAEVRRVATIQENEVLPKLQLLYENQVKAAEEHQRMDAIEAKQEEQGHRIFGLEEAVKELQAV